MKKIIIVGIIVLIAIAILGALNSIPEEKHEIKFGSMDTVERCNQLRESGFFAGSGNDANTPEQRNNLYENCIKRAQGDLP